MQMEVPSMIASLSVFSEVLSGQDHRIYYTCVQESNKSWSCQKGQHLPQSYSVDQSMLKPSKLAHICAFQVSGDTKQAYDANAKVAFEKKYPNHFVKPLVLFIADTARNGSA